MSTFNLLYFILIFVPSVSYQINAVIFITMAFFFLFFHSSAGVLLGLAVRCLPFDWGQHAVNIGETVCACGGLNSTPHILTVNITPRLHYYRHVGKVNQSCPPVSGPLVSMATSSDLYFKYILQKQIFCVGTGENETTWLSVLQREPVKKQLYRTQDVFFSSNDFFYFVWNNTYFFSPLLLWSPLFFFPFVCWVFTSTVSSNGA